MVSVPQSINEDMLDLELSGCGMQLIESAANLFAICQDGKIVYMNKAGLKLMGADDTKQVLGAPLVDFIHADYKEFLAYGLEVLAEEDDFIPLKFQTLGGESLDVKMMVNELVAGDTLAHVVEVQNITDFIRASEAVRVREHRITSILNTVTEGIVTFNQDAVIDTFNPAAEKIFGYSAQEVIGQNVNILMPEKERAKYTRFLNRKIINGNSRLMGRLWEVNGQHKCEGRFPLEMTVTKLRVGNEDIFTAVCRDITERKQNEERIRHLAHHDQLTGLPNRHLFGDRLSHAIKIATRYKKSLVLMFVDLDKFKPINDRLGHEAGDVVLKTVAQRLKSLVRESDTVARIGGDEFVVLLEVLDDPNPGPRVAQNIIDSFVDPILVAGQKCYLGSSIGIARFPHDADTAEELLRCADEAMYAVKMAGRNNYQIYDPSLNILKKNAG